MDKNSEKYIEFRKKCNEANKRYYSKPEVKEKKNIYSKKYRIENKEKISEYGKKIRALPKTQERLKRWKKENREHIREYSRTPTVRIRKKISDKKWRDKKKQDSEWLEEERKRLKFFRESNPKNVKIGKRRYYQSEKGKINSTYHNHRRLALIKNTKTDLTNVEMKEFLKNNKYCVYCRKGKKLEIDHVIPLSKGGSCMKVNLVMSCDKCNRSKSGRDVIEWCRLMGREVPKIIIDRLEEMGV